MIIVEKVRALFAADPSKPIEIPKDEFKALTIECMTNLTKDKDWYWPQSDRFILMGELEIHVRIKR